MSELRARWLLAEKLPDAWMRDYIRDGLIRDGFRLGAKTLADILVSVDLTYTQEQSDEIQTASRDEALDIVVRRVLMHKPSLKNCERCSCAVETAELGLCKGCQRYCCYSCLGSAPECLGCYISLSRGYSRGYRHTSGWGGG